MVTLHKLTWGFQRPENHTIDIEFSGEKDPKSIRSISEYLLFLIQDLHDSDEIELANLLQDSQVRLPLVGRAYTRRAAVAMSPFFNQSRTEQNTAKSGRYMPILSVNWTGAPNKWVDMSLIISPRNGTSLSKEQYIVIADSLKRVDEMRINPLPKSSKRPLWDIRTNVVNLFGSIFEPTLVSSVVDKSDIIVEPGIQPVQDITVSTVPVPQINIIKKSWEHYEDSVTIPDELLNMILYSFKNDPSLEIVDWKRRLYFIPETAVDGILKDGTIYNMSKEFIAETVIRENLPLSFARRQGSFRVVIRVNKWLYDDKKDTYALSTRNQMDLLTAGLDIHILGDRVLQYIPHKLEDIRIAMETTGVHEDGLRSFYSTVNKGSSVKEPTIRKGYLVTIPPDFNEELYRETHLKRLTTPELIERIAIIDTQLGILKTKNEQENISILALEQTIEEKIEENLTKKTTLSSSRNQLEAQRRNAIMTLNIRENMPIDTTVDSIGKFVTRQIALLQSMIPALDSVRIDSDEQTRITEEIQRTEVEIEQLEFSIINILLSIESDEAAFTALSKERIILIQDKDRRRVVLEDKLRLLGE
jgi:hypothetical protein